MVVGVRKQRKGRYKARKVCKSPGGSVYARVCVRARAYVCASVSVPMWVCMCLGAAGAWPSALSRSTLLPYPPPPGHGHDSDGKEGSVSQLHFLSNPGPPEIS